MSDRTQSAYDRNEGVAPPPPGEPSGNGMMPTRAQSKPLTEVKSIREALTHPEMIKRFQQAVPGHLSPQRMLRVMALAVQKTPRLLECEIMSLLGAMLALASLGLEPNTPMGLAYLIPFAKRAKNEKTGRWEDAGYDVQVIIGYRGYIDLARRAGTLVSIHADVVYEGDEFSFEYGSRAHLKHIPMGTREDRRPVWAYAHVRLTDGEAFEVWPYAQVLKIRDGSQGYQSALRYKQTNPKGFAAQPWVAFEHPMAAKTMVRSVAKMLPMSIELANAAALDAMSEGGKVNLRSLSMVPAEQLPDMAMLGYDDAFPNFDLGGFNPQDAGAEREMAETAENEPTPAKEAKRPAAPSGESKPRPGLKKIDPKKYPPGETLEHARERVGADQEKHGVAEGEEDLRGYRAEQTERKPATREEVWGGVEVDQAAGKAAAEANAAARRAEEAAAAEAERSAATENAPDEEGARFEARVLDFKGDPHDRGAMIFDPAQYVRKLAAYVATLTPDLREQAIDWNGSYIEAAETVSEEAAKLWAASLSAGEETATTGGGDAQAAEGEKAPAGQQDNGNLVVRLEGAKYAKLVDDCAADLDQQPDAALDEWLAANRAYWNTKTVPASTRTRIEDKFAARKKRGAAPEPSAEEVAANAQNARLVSWALTICQEIDKVKTAEQCRDLEITILDGASALGRMFAAVRDAGGDRFENIKRVFTAKAAEVGYQRQQ